jgi:hypothetical protein
MLKEIDIMTKNIKVFLTIIIVVMIIGTWLAVEAGIRYNLRLGFYDSSSYCVNVGEYMKYGEEAINYTYTHLDLIGIVIRTFA